MMQMTTSTVAYPQEMIHILVPKIVLFVAIFVCFAASVFIFTLLVAYHAKQGSCHIALIIKYICNRQGGEERVARCYNPNPEL